MREGLEIIDTDQHVGPNMETLHKFAGPRLLERWDELVPVLRAGHRGPSPQHRPDPVQARPQHRHRREPDEAGGAGGTIPLRKAVKQNFEVKPVAEVNNENWQGPARGHGPRRRRRRADLPGHVLHGVDRARRGDAERAVRRLSPLPRRLLR